MVVKPAVWHYNQSNVFESDVILNGGQAFPDHCGIAGLFESDVILNGGQAGGGD